MFQGTFLLLAATGAIEAPAVLTQDLWLSLVATTIGSVVIGLFCGTLLSIVHGKLTLAETSLIFFAMFIVLGAGEKWLLTYVGLSFNFLLTALTVGAVFCNVAIDAEKLNDALRSVGAPIFAGFFVMAGYSLHLEELVHLGWVGGAYVVCRTLAKVFGGGVGVRWARQQERVGLQVGSTLLCQAAVHARLDRISAVGPSAHNGRCHHTTAVVRNSTVIHLRPRGLVRYVRRCPGANACPHSRQRFTFRPSSTYQRLRQY